ncbi:MAG: hypothetical protein JW705_09525 [Methanosarcinaceae archaeon]|nr:hypothetical protein [Methanosarcinaceae archaeon]
MEVELTVDGEPIEINSFVQQMLGSAVAGAIGTLRGVDESCTEILLRIKK